jgi:hypothetical protein
MNPCLWCGDEYSEGMEGCCRSCWEKNQFPGPEVEEEPPQRSLWKRNIVERRLKGGGEMITAKFQRLAHSGTNQIIVEGGRFGKQEASPGGGVWGGHSIFDSVIGHCMKDLSAREVAEVYRQLCIQMNQLGPDNIPMTWQEMFDEFKVEMANRKILI